MKWLEEEFKRNFDIKTEFLGPRNDQSQEVRILNRIIRWTSGGLTYEADQRHAEILIKELGLENSKPVSTPGAREDIVKASYVIIDDDNKPVNDVEDDKAGELLSKQDATKYRGLAARANFLSQDRADLQYATKEVARRMATPRVGDWNLLKRLGRYLVGAPRVVYEYPWQSAVQNCEGYIDSDWGGCKGSRRSTSGGVLMSGLHVLKTWSTTQATVALSSAEAELFALVKGASQALGMMAIGRDLGIPMQVTLHSDASAALGIIQRQGVGKMRHVSTQYLWIQEKTRQDIFDIAKIPGDDNPSDILTKNVPAELLHKHMYNMHMAVHGDRAKSAPTLAYVGGDPQGGPGDHWAEHGRDPETQSAWTASPHEGHVVMRHHKQPRRELFTPMRVQGAPPARALTSARITRGIFLDTGQEFYRADSWRARDAAHQDLGRAWIGSTTFFANTECGMERDR